MKHARLLSAVLLLLTPQLAITNTLDPVIVTATRVAQTADDTLSSVTVISREQIVQQQAQSIQDLLRGVAGLDISNNGGLGKTSSLFLRGSESDHLLVLIDGIKVGSASLGTTPFQDIPIEQIERIEIVRGPRSSLYGSEAIGGVIQIFTRKGTGAFTPNASISAGRYDTYSASTGLSGGTHKSWFHWNISSVDSKGFNACDGVLFPVPKGCFTNEPDKDGYRNISQSARMGYRFSNGLELEIRGLHTEGDNDYDGSFVNESDTTLQLLGSSIRFSPSDIWHLTVNAGRNLDRSKNYKNDNLQGRIFQNRFSSERDLYSWQNDISLTNTQMISIGADHQNDEVGGTTTYAVTSRDNNGVFGQYQGSFGIHEIQFSLRWDDNEQFGEHLTEGLSWGYHLQKNRRMTVSYGSAFKAPSFNELYFPGFGNAELDPETSHTLEWSLTTNTSWGKWSVHTYESRVDDLISFDLTTFAAANLDQARIRGIETIVMTTFKGWELNLDLTLLDPKIDSDDTNDGNLLPRRSRQSMRISANRAVGSYIFGATIISVGERYNDLANTERLGGYSIIDLRTEYLLANNWRLQVRIENLFDKKYETADLFNQSGRNFNVALRYRL
ncbi:MAG TPA: TonB-dependent vitamin B12 receptor [Gammaproteobacteria bacterium]|nr:TonB-dependent vitamin B12 receptor [Gammaproteobacteria bacterium]